MIAFWLGSFVFGVSLYALRFRGGWSSVFGCPCVFCCFGGLILCFSFALSAFAVLVASQKNTTSYGFRRNLLCVGGRQPSVAWWAFKVVFSSAFSGAQHSAERSEKECRELTYVSAVSTWPSVCFLSVCFVCFVGFCFLCFLFWARGPFGSSDSAPRAKGPSVCVCVCVCVCARCDAAEVPRSLLGADHDNLGRVLGEASASGVH